MSSSGCIAYGTRTSFRQFRKFTHPDFVGHFPKASPFGELRGHSGIRGAIETVRCAFPDWTETIEDVVIEGDKVVTRYKRTGVHKGAFFDLAPTGKSIRTEEISIFRVQNGRVAE